MKALHLWPIGLTSAVLLVSFGCSSIIPPPPQPPQSVPVLTLDPPPGIDGLGRIAVTAVGHDGDLGPFAVDVVLASSVNVQLQAEQVACHATPCVANLPYGNYTLKLRHHKNGQKGFRAQMAEVPVVIGRKPSIVNVVVGRWDGWDFGGKFQGASYIQWAPADQKIFELNAGPGPAPTQDTELQPTPSETVAEPFGSLP